jgi:hypothetical protein
LCCKSLREFTWAIPEAELSTMNYYIPVPIEFQKILGLEFFNVAICGEDDTSPCNITKTKPIYSLLKSIDTVGSRLRLFSEIMRICIN